MEPKKSSAVSWLALGAILILLLFAYAYMGKYTSIRFSMGIDGLVSAMGAAGAIFLIIGIIKVIIEHLRK